jgi:CHAT domain-containing protein
VGYQDVAWLGRRNPITVVPSVANLIAMRKAQPKTHATAAYIGFGNPILVGNSDCGSTKIPNSCGQLTRVASSKPLPVRSDNSEGDSSPVYFRGLLANVETVRQICPLPETAQEISCVAKSFGRKGGKLVIGSDFTEAAVKRMPLDRYRVIHFATHGLLADQTQRLTAGLADPALVMTPPKVPSALDDGLLTASEIAELKLNADWVVLSACNTAGGAHMGAEALSGLARAFFYAGARNLLVSHWEVESGAAVRLASGAFSELARNPTLRPAEALQRAMVAMMEDANPAFSLPSIWAPFVVIGEGRALVH